MSDFDAIVIGSGAGGLTAAVALANAGKRVVVFEQHYLPGGWCHSFTLSGYRFSPGIHYIGELHPGGGMRSMFEGLGLGADLAFLELHPDGYDHILAGGQRFDIPAGRDRFEERLARRFPDEREGIRRYLDTCHAVTREISQIMEIRSVGDGVRTVLRSPNLARWGLRSAKALIDAHARDPFLRAILAGQSGNNGLPPSMAPAVLHAGVTGHYLRGGWYPRGGAYTIPRAFVRALRRAGGEIHVKTAIDKILVENRRAIGVRLADGTEVRAPIVISNADPAVTYGRLVGREHLSRLLRAGLARTKWSVSALSLFLATDLDLPAAGLDSGNYWLYESNDLEAIYKSGLTASGTERPVPPGQFVTVTTLKDPSKLRANPDHHTIESFSFVGFEAFRRWAHTRYGERPEDYERLKRDLLARMIRGAARIIPGLEGRIRFADLGTPLTNVHYVAATRGNLYGTEKSRWQLGPFSFSTKTELEGLYLCGSSTLAHGVAGAVGSGLVAASQVLGCRARELYRPGGAPITIGHPTPTLTSVPAWQPEAASA
jgi:phytoene dehydrogenase-like protein